jgi:hypothetical protein
MMIHGFSYECCANAFLAAQCDVQECNCPSNASYWRSSRNRL